VLDRLLESVLGGQGQSGVFALSLASFASLVLGFVVVGVNSEDGLDD